MKKAFTLCLMLLSGIVVFAADILGNWQGLIPVGDKKLRLVFHINKSATGFSSTFDSPDQNAFGINCNNTSLTNDSLLITIEAIKGGFKGKWNGADEIKGIFFQGARNIDMSLSRVAANESPKQPTAPNRPQTPKPPFQYDQEELEYDNADKTIHYGATLTKPRNLKSFPTVIIISGSGSQDRDGTLFGHKLYAVLADYLTNQGIGVLRVDDRGMGKSSLGGDPNLLTSADFSKDVETSFNYLLSRTDLDKKKIGLIGHSEGGIIAPMVAARRKDIAFIILWAGPVEGGLQTNVEQNEHSLLNAGVDSLSAKEFSKLHSSILSHFADTKKEGLDTMVSLQFASWKKGLSKETVAALYVKENSVVGREIHTLYHSLYDLAWMRFFITYHPSQDLAKVTCPVLAINGTKDTQVDAKKNLDIIKSVLIRSGNKHFQVTPLASLNHLFQTAKTGELAEYATMEETISPLALSLIAGWIKDEIK